MSIDGEEQGEKGREDQKRSAELQFGPRIGRRAGGLRAAHPRRRRRPVDRGHGREQGLHVAQIPLAAFHFPQPLVGVDLGPQGSACSAVNFLQDCNRCCRKYLCSKVCTASSILSASSCWPRYAWWGAAQGDSGRASLSLCSGFRTYVR